MTREELWTHALYATIVGGLLLSLGWSIYSCEQQTQTRIAACIEAGREPLTCRAAIRGGEGGR